MRLNIYIDHILINTEPVEIENINNLDDARYFVAGNLKKEFNSLKYKLTLSRLFHNNEQIIKVFLQCDLKTKRDLLIKKIFE